MGKDTNLISAHEAAERFHSAMARALGASSDIEDLKRMASNRVLVRHGIAPMAIEITDREQNYREALREAAVALREMPPEWAAVLGKAVPEQRLHTEAA